MILDLFNFLVFLFCPEIFGHFILCLHDPRLTLASSKHFHLTLVVVSIRYFNLHFRSKLEKVLTLLKGLRSSSIMTTMVICSRSFPNLFKIGPQYSWKSSKETITKVLEPEISKLSLNALRLNKRNAGICNADILNFKVNKEWLCARFAYLIHAQSYKMWRSCSKEVLWKKWRSKITFV